jgi:hypothetical protein
MRVRQARSEEPNEPFLPLAASVRAIHRHGCSLSNRRQKRFLLPSALSTKFAEWLGLVVTALNLMPISQRDGGHMAHPMFGPKRGHAIGVGALITLFALALFVWPGLMF